MPDASNVRVALTGAIYTAPVGTIAPATPTASWGAGWVDLGYVSEDGVTESYSDDTAEIKAWQGGATVRKMITGSEVSFALTLLETSAAVLEVYHKGSSVVAQGATPNWSSLQVAAAQADERAWGLDVVDGDNHIRIVIPRGEVTERGDITYKNDEAISYELTITAYPDNAGVVATKMSDSVAWLP